MMSLFYIHQQQCYHTRLKQVVLQHIFFLEHSIAALIDFDSLFDIDLWRFGFDLCCHSNQWFDFLGLHIHCFYWVSEGVAVGGWGCLGIDEILPFLFLHSPLHFGLFLLLGGGSSALWPDSVQILFMKDCCTFFRPGWNESRCCASITIIKLLLTLSINTWCTLLFPET